jgi:Membrane-bound toxin component of toxin-antitoxin system
LTGSAPPLVLHATESRQLRVYLLSTHALAAAAVLALPVAVPLRLGALALLVVAAAWCAFRRAQLRTLVVHGDGACTVTDTRGDIWTGVVGRGSRAGLGLVLIAVERTGGGRRHYLLLGDAAAPGDLRRLRVRLRVAA